MSISPQFHNRPNPRIQTQDGRTLHHARANAVVAEICLYDIQRQTWSILLMQRGLQDAEFAGYWALPAGYLDWDETLYQAMQREVYEETGLWLPAVLAHAPAVIADPKPWRINDAPTDQKQNLAFHYAVLFAWSSAEYPTLSVQSEDPRETLNAKWVDLQQAAEMNLAFVHQKHIRQLLLQHAEDFSRLAAEVS